MPKNQSIRHRTPDTRNAAKPCPDGALCPPKAKVYKTHAHAWAAITKRRSEPDQFWEYKNRNDELVGLTLRWNLAGGEKDIRPLARTTGGWIIGAMPSPRPLYRLGDVLNGANVLKRVYVVEGEKAADAGHAIGLITTTSAGGAAAAHLSDWSTLAGRDIVLLPDNDDAGRKYAAAVIAQLIRLTPLPTIRQVRLPDLREGEDLHDFIGIRDDQTTPEIVALIESLCDGTAKVGSAEQVSGVRCRVSEGPDTCPTSSSDTRHQTPDTPPAIEENLVHTNPLITPADPLDPTPVITRLADCQSSPIQWLWPGRVPAGKLTLLAGDPGLGKSFITLDIAARISRGEPLPRLAGEDASATRSMPGSVVLLSAEDDVRDTIRPRLVAAQGDLSRIVALEAVKCTDANTGRSREESFSLTSDLAILERVIASLDNCRLVVIDPITAYLGAADSHKNAEMRSLLAPLSDLAMRTGVAVLVINHLNKTNHGPAIYRSMGSLAFAASARSVMAAVADPYAPGACVLVLLKSNLSLPVDGMRYRIAPRHEADETGAGTMVPTVAWEDNPVCLSADELLAAAAQMAASGPAIAEAADWLVSALAGGPQPAVELKQRAKNDGVHERTLLRAKQRLGVVACREGFGPAGRWTWQLPKP
jgi:hypothetical protein